MIPSPMTLEFKFPVIFEDVAMIDALQSCDFVVDVTLAAWTFDGHCSVPLRGSGLENSPVRSSTEKTAFLFSTETNLKSALVNQLELTITGCARY